MQTNRPQHYPSYKIALVLAAIIAAGPSWAQQAAKATNAKPAKEEEEVLQLSPFEVSAEATTGYAAATTLAGNRLATELRDIGNAVTVITSQFLKDIGATDNKSLLQYTTNTEVGGIYGNFSGAGDSSHLDESGKFTNPNQNTRIRGLTAADNTRDYFLTDIPWEGYNIDGVDLQRGPNSILFGQGSPAGIINTRTKTAAFKDSNEVSIRVGSFGSTRETVDFNKVLLKNELAVRLSAVRNDEQYKQDPAFSLSKRLYAAVRYEPGFLKKDSARTIIKANIEYGNTDSNNPRQLSPNDRISPWFYTGTTAGRDVGNNPFNFANLNRITPNQIEMEDDNTGVAGHGLDRPSHNGPGGLYLVGGTNYLLPKYANQAGTGYALGNFGGNPNEYYNPWIAGSLLGVFGSPAFIYTDTNATQNTAINWEPQGYHGMDVNGNVGVRNNSVTPYLRAGSIQSYSGFAKNAKLYYNGLPAWAFGLYKDKTLTDPSIFDYYNNLFDGPTKHEFQKFRAYNVSLAQTFMHEQVGFEVTYNNETFKSGKRQLLTDDSINLDLNRAYNDAHAEGKNGIPYEDGTPNPNVGKPYVGGNGLFGNNVQTNIREDARLTIFADHDFSKDGSGWVHRLLGRHVITGLLSTDKIKTDNRSYSLYSIHDPAWEFLNNPSPTDAAKPSFISGSLTPFTFIYLGKSLSGASSSAGAYIPNPDVNPVLTSGKALQFDATWKPSRDPAASTYVDPAGFWHDPYRPTVAAFTTDGKYRDSSGNIITNFGDGQQFNNPSNYVGVRPYNINIINSSLSKANLDANTRDARLTKSTVSSRAFDWQAHFWDNALIGTFGVRKDIAKSWTYSINTSQGDPNNDQRLFLSPSVYHLADTPNNSLEVTSHAWTAVAHLNQLSFLKRLPVQVTMFYNHSTDFQPAAQRVDVYGVPLGAPSGVTKDYGLLLETNDGRYSVKLNKYETTSSGASSAGLGGAWFIGSSQAWAGNWVNRFEFNWTNDTIAGFDSAMSPTNTIANYEPAPGETLVQAQAREASVIAAWRTWQKSVDPRFYAAWQINLNDKTKSIGASVPAGFAVTEDSVSQGYELEFNASPIRNWRFSLNASKTTAQRNNIGGTNLKAFMAAYTKFLGTGAPGTGGDLRIWWGGAGNETALQEWNGNINSEFNQRKLQEGTNVPELRKWRYNAITNYDFDHGILKGVNVGGGMRYESSVVIGYKPIAGATASEISFDIANPYVGPSDTSFDLWVGYNRRMWHEINWSIQLNVRNVGVKNELVPITTQPDGSAASYRIRAPQTVMLTNTFRF